MTVDDQTSLRIHPELSQDLVTEFCLVNEREVRVLGFAMRCFVVNEVTFEGRNAVLAEQRRTRATPKIPKER